MQFRTHIAAALAVLAVVGCAGERTTGPEDDANRAASELERAAGELGLGADPSAALTYQTVAAALRGGAHVSQVDIAVGGEVQKWYAFGHQIVFDPASGGNPVDFLAPAPLRALLAWRSAGTKVQVIHLLATGDAGPIGRFDPLREDGEASLEFPSSLLYSEGRNLFWDAVQGEQTSESHPTTTACPSRPRPAGAPPAPTCVLATFKFGFTGVQALPFAFPLSPLASAPPGATGARTLSMPPQAVEGVQMTIDMRVIGFRPAIGVFSPQSPQ